MTTSVSRPPSKFKFFPGFSLSTFSHQAVVSENQQHQSSDRIENTSHNYYCCSKTAVYGCLPVITDVLLKIKEMKSLKIIYTLTKKVMKTKVTVSQTFEVSETPF